MQRTSRYLLFAFLILGLTEAGLGWYRSVFDGFSPTFAFVAAALVFALGALRAFGDNSTRLGAAAGVLGWLVLAIGVFASWSMFGAVWEPLLNRIAVPVFLLSLGAILRSRNTTPVFRAAFVALNAVAFSLLQLEGTLHCMHDFERHMGPHWH